ncbi:helix-turn-helix domain-containing protein [Saccharopolyspora spinosporotrichia]
MGKEAAEEVRREAEAANRAAQQRWQEAVASKQAAEQLWNEAARRKQVAEQTWWQAKQYYEFQLAKARTESDLAGGPADVSVTFPDDADTLPLSKLVELNGVTRKALDHAVETGRPARIRYVVHGDLRAVDEAHQSRAKRDFSEAMGQLRRSLNLVQAGMGTPNHARLGPEAVGLYATPQFLHSEGPTRVQIWVEQDAAVHEDGSGGHEPADARGQEPVESASGWSREDLRREAQQARSSLDDADAAERQRLRRGAAAVLARHHDFTGQTNGRAEHDLAALREDMEAVVAQRLSESGETRARELSRGLAEWFQTWRGVRAGAGPEPADGGMPPEGGETGLKRARGGRTLRGVARAIGVTHSTLSRWEKGRGDIDPHYRERLAAFYGVSQEELFADIPEASGETRLKRERARVGRTQREVAEKIGVHLSTLSNWEHGRDNIAPRHRERLAAFYGVSQEELFADMPEASGETGLKRARGGRTLREVASAIEVTSATLSRWEHGRGISIPIIGRGWLHFMGFLKRCFLLICLRRARSSGWLEGFGVCRRLLWCRWWIRGRVGMGLWVWRC